MKYRYYLLYFKIKTFSGLNKLYKTTAFTDVRSAAFIKRTLDRVLQHHGTSMLTRYCLKYNRQIKVCNHSL